MGGNLWEDDAWKAVVDTGLKVWAFDGEQDTNNIDNIARYIKLCKRRVIRMNGLRRTSV
jgi:hypothetical protein